MTSLYSCCIQQAHTSNSQKTILVVEAHPIIQELLVSSFTLFQYQCAIIDEVASLTWIEQTAQTPPDAIVLDIDILTREFRKPLDFLHAFYAAWQSTGLQMRPLLVLTSQPMNHNYLIQEGYTVLLKPFKLRHLLRSVQTLMERQGGGPMKQKATPLMLQIAYRKEHLLEDK